MATFLQKRHTADPLAFMRRITEELDRAFGPREDPPWAPELYPRMWAPQIEVTHDELTIEGERKLEKEEKEEGAYRTERTYGRFFRRIEIPEYVKAENAVAVFKNGVLEIEMPAIPIPEVRKRTVEIAG